MSDEYIIFTELVLGTYGLAFAHLRNDVERKYQRVVRDLENEIEEEGVLIDRENGE
tara:strand:+ start:471 stop:638 length:168 start_codon:yes stop_codon:yes gene_type:complete